MRISDTPFSGIKGQNKGQAKTDVFLEHFERKTALYKENRLIS